MGILPSDGLAGKFNAIWDVSQGREKIVVGFLHPVNPFRLRPEQIAYVKTFYMSTDYKHELADYYPGVKHPSMYTGFLILSKYNLTEAEALDFWHQFEDVPMHPVTERIERPFLHFPAGTDRERIWKWFDANWPRGVYNLIYEGGAAK